LSDRSVMCTWLQKSRFTEMSDAHAANTPQYVVVNDLMQTDYRYDLSEPMGENFDSRFKPELTPAQMLKMGVFGGRYMTDCLEEYPDDWFSSAKLSPRVRKPALNFFNVDASKPLSYWKEKGWIHDDDPRGWFQWYCRYFMGRRHADDEWQIKRWRNMTRHISQLKKNCIRGDLLCRPRQRQALLHWAYDSRRF
jgi:hypothetical protein